MGYLGRTFPSYRFNLMRRLFCTDPPIGDGSRLRQESRQRSRPMHVVMFTFMLVSGGQGPSPSAEGDGQSMIVTKQCPCAACCDSGRGTRCCPGRSWGTRCCPGRSCCTGYSCGALGCMFSSYGFLRPFRYALHSDSYPRQQSYNYRRVFDYSGHVAPRQAQGYFIHQVRQPAADEVLVPTPAPQRLPSKHSLPIAPLPPPLNRAK